MPPRDLFQEAGLSAPKDLLAGVPAPAAEQSNQRSAVDVALGIGRPSQLTPEQQAAFKDAMTRGFGSGVPKFFYDLGGKVTDLTGSPAAGFAANVLPQALMSLYTMPKGLPSPTSGEQSANALASQRQKVLEAGKNLGLKVPPSQVNPSLGNRVLESVGGKIATGQQAAATNQDLIYQVAQREAGIAPNQPINSESLAAARDAMSQPYRDIANLESSGPLSQPPFKSPAQTLEALKDARNEAKQLWAYYNRQQIPEVLRQAKAASTKADAIEQALEAQATAAGRPDLVDQLRAARVALAKNYTVERAMRGSSFDPSALAKLESRANVPLSGDLETLLQMQKDFPKAMAAPQVGGSVGVNQLMPWLGGSAGGLAGATLGGPHGAALGAPAGVILGQTIPPAARAIMLSPLYQSLFANVPQDLGNPSLLRLLASPALAQSLGALHQR